MSHLFPVSSQQCGKTYVGATRISAESVDVKFHDERVPSRQTIHNLANKLE
jgi:hypothetical protein